MMTQPPKAAPAEKPFEELASEWAPRARHFLTLVADQLTLRVKKRLPSVISGSAYLFAAVFCAGALLAWLSTAGWSALRELGYSSSLSALMVAGAFLILATAFGLAARSHARSLRPSAPMEILGPENHEIEEAGQDLITLFKDLTIAAKRSLSPNEVLKPHAVKLAVASTALGLLVALNLSTRKEKIR